MTFQIDPRLLSSSVFICQWELSNVYLKNESAFPWFVLIPRVKDVREIYQLSQTQQQALMEEISRMSAVLAEEYNPDKMNVGSLGNIVPQLHIHIVGRYQSDPCWPDSIWQPAYQPTPYSDSEIESIQRRFQQLLS